MTIQQFIAERKATRFARFEQTFCERLIQVNLAISAVLLAISACNLLRAAYYLHGG